MSQKVLFTASTYSHIRNFHLPYLRRFSEEGWTVHVACGGKPMALPDAQETIDLPFEKSMFSPKNFKATAVLRKKISAEKYDLIITHTSLAAFFTRLAVKGMKSRPRLINVAHGYLFGEAGVSAAKNKILIAAEKLTAKQTDLVLTMNDWDYAAAKKYALAPIVHKIPGIGVDFEARCTATPDARSRLRREWGVSEEAFVLFYAAEFSDRKNQAMLIRAMQQLPERVVLVLAGAGDLLEMNKELAQRLELSHRVIFPGYVSNVADCYAAADAAVSASRSEGLPFNIMEAMYAGLPVVASAVKGHMDLIIDGETGLLYPYNEENEYAGRVSSLCTSREACTHLGENAAARVSQYRIETALPATMNYYDSFAGTGA